MRINVKGPQLQAATNIVFYALTRPRGLTTKRTQPLWAKTTGVSQQVSDRRLLW